MGVRELVVLSRVVICEKFPKGVIADRQHTHETGSYKEFIYAHYKRKGPSRWRDVQQYFQSQYDAELLKDCSFSKNLSIESHILNPHEVANDCTEHFGIRSVVLPIEFTSTPHYNYSAPPLIREIMQRPVNECSAYVTSMRPIMYKLQQAEQVGDVFGVMLYRRKLEYLFGTVPQSMPSRILPER